MAAADAPGPDGSSAWQRLYTQAANAPCFRAPLMWGLACGLAAGLHKFRIHRASPRTCFYGLGWVGMGGRGGAQVPACPPLDTRSIGFPSPTHAHIHTGAIMNACDFAVLGMGASTSLGWWVASTCLRLCWRLSIPISFACAFDLTDHPSIHPSTPSL